MVAGPPPSSSFPFPEIPRQDSNAEELTNNECQATNSKSQLIINIEEMLIITKPSKSSNPHIYRVPDELRKFNQEAYTPQVISIGPYHHGEERYKSMEKLKVECLEIFRRRTKKNVEDLVNIITKQEGRIRDCYADDIKFGRNDFVKIILVDASFIVESLIGSERLKLLDPWLWNTILRDLRKLENQIPFFVVEELYDLLLSSYCLECPSCIWLSLDLFVRDTDKIEIFSAIPDLKIEHFLDLLRTSLLAQPQEPQGPPEEKNDPIKLCINWLKTSLGLLKRRSNEEDEDSESSTPSHEADNGNDQVERSPDMTQLETGNQLEENNEEDEHSESDIQSHGADNGNGRVESSPNMIQLESGNQLQQLWESRGQFHHESENLPSVAELHRAGARLEASSSNWLLKLEFKKGVLKIPKLWITDGTESYFRNILAFEQRHYLNTFKQPHYLGDYNVTNYVTLLDSLINNTEDVDLLVEAGIIVNWIGDNNTVTTLVNNLGKNLWRSNETEDYYELSNDLKAFCKNPYHSWRATFIRDYFSTPWRIASTSAAIILLVLTFIQTICSLIPFL